MQHAALRSAQNQNATTIKHAHALAVSSPPRITHTLHAAPHNAYILSDATADIDLVNRSVFDMTLLKK